MVKRFQREARAASQLTHPNIVTVHDLGQAEDGTLYIAMELVRGDEPQGADRREGRRIAPSRCGAPYRPPSRARSRSPTGTTSCTATSSRRT